MKKQLYRAAAATVLGLSLTTGIVAADTGNISTTGPGSSNEVESRVTNNRRLTNNNRVNLGNSNYQAAYSGDARTSWNTTAGDAYTGAAANNNSTNATVAVNNSASNTGGNGGAWMGGAAAGMGGSINTTGPGSRNEVESTVTDNSQVTNNNTVTVTNSNSQTAGSGDARVSGNTTGGSAVTGDATNTNSSTFDISVTN